MTAFDALTTRVVNKYKGSSGAAFTTQAGQAINDAIEYYQSEHFWFTEGTANITLAIGSPELTTATGFPTDFWYLHPDGGLAIVQSQQRFKVEKAKVSQYDYWNNQGTGRPDIYRELAGGIQVYPYPDQAYALEFRYVKKYAVLTGANSNDYTLNAPQLIEARALSMLFLSEGHDGADMYTTWAGVEGELLTAMRLTNTKRVGTGNLTTN